MKLTCPVCGYYGAIEGFLTNEDYKKALAVICSMPGDLPSLLVKYLGLFRKPGSNRALTGTKILKICTQIEKFINDKHIQWKNKRILENNVKYWVEALNIILEKDESGRIERPLGNNNLLRAIAYDLAEKDFEEKVRQKEMRLKSSTREEQTAENNRPLSPDQIVKKLQEMRKRLGSK